MGAPFPISRTQSALFFPEKVDDLSRRYIIGLHQTFAQRLDVGLGPRPLAAGVPSHGTTGAMVNAAVRLTLNVVALMLAPAVASSMSAVMLG